MTETKKTEAKVSFPIKKEPVVVKPVTKKKICGSIARNPNIGNYRCTDVNGRCVLTTSSLALARRRCPDFELVKE